MPVPDRPAGRRPGQAPDPSPREAAGAADAVTWLGHATVLAEVSGVRLLTDPVLTPWMGPLRNRAAGLARVEDVDAALVSHVHYDHLHLPSLRQLAAGTAVIAPRGVGRIAGGAAPGPVVELAVGESTQIGPVTVRATYAAHQAGRGRHGRVECLGFVIDGGHRIYFAGDTDMFAGMAEIDDGLDLALLPVGGWGLTLGPGHLDPVRAALTLRLLQPRAALPIHWGTMRPPAVWRIRSHLWTSPGERFAHHAARFAPEVTVHVSAPGSRIILDGVRPW
jgi:L-ascorbate metabolism protein UlaG (beta-lactamase superfamily)